MRIYINNNFQMNIESLKNKYNSLTTLEDREFESSIDKLVALDLNNVYADIIEEKIIKFYIRSPQQISFIAKEISKDFQSSHNLRLSLSELLMNSLEHGNLKIDDDTKHEMISSGNYYELLEHLVESNKDKYIELEYDFGQQKYIKILDKGDGFHYRKYLNKDDIADMTYSGRGINIAKAELPKNNADFKYINNGNQLIIEFS